MDWNTALNDLIIVIIPAIAAFILRLVVPEVFAWIGTHAAFAKNMHALAVLRTITEQFVTAASTESVNTLKSDGRWSPQEGARIKQAVAVKIASALPGWAHQILAALTDDLGSLIGAQIEQVVASNQASGIQAKVAATANPPSSPAVA